MPTKLESYMNMLLNDGGTKSSGFLGAYNTGVWGISVSGEPLFEEGLLASGNVLTRAPRSTAQTMNNPNATNFVKFYDTPNLWGLGDLAEHRLYAHACTTLGLSPDEGLSESDLARVQAYMKVHGGVDFVPRPWREIAKTSDVQRKMDERGAWNTLVDRWRAVLAQSCFLADVTSLSPPVPGSEAQRGICGGIADALEAWIAASGRAPAQARPLMIRLLFGMTATDVPMTKTFWTEFLADLTKTLRPLRTQISGLVSRGATPPVVLYGSDMGKMISTFNHSKIVAGDGVYALVGGHNMCEEVSSNKAAVIHDITAEVTGPGARSANLFAASLWLKAAESGRLYVHRFNWQSGAFDDLTSDSAKRWAPSNWMAYGLGDQDKVPAVLQNQYWYYPMARLPVQASYPPPEGSVRATAIMGIGRWGDTSVFGRDGSKGLKLNTPIPMNLTSHFASDLLKRLLISDTKNTVIRMSQQDLVNAGFFGGRQNSEHTICELLGKRLKATPKGTAIQIVVSSRFTQNSEGLAYSYGDGPREAAERISDSLVGSKQASSNATKLPDRLEALDLSKSIGSAEVYAIESSNDPSFCTVAPLAFCEARGTTRDRGSYVWPDARYVMEKIYTNGRFWDSVRDKNELKFGPGNHAKVMCVSEGDDDATGLVMIGSDNMYPSPLSEFNFVIEGEEAIRAFRTQYWDKLWRYSARLGFTVKSNGDVK